MGRSPMRLPTAWEGAISGWLTWLKLGGSSVSTRRARRDHVRSIAHRSETNHPRQLSFAKIAELCSERDWSLEYRKGMRTSLISFSEWALSNGLIDENPAMLLPKVSVPMPAPRPAPENAWRDLLEAAPPRERLMARLAGEAGLRRAEVARSHRDDLVRDNSGWSLIVKGKGGKQRVVPITQDLAAAIRSHADAGYLFSDGNSSHITPGWVGSLVSGLLPPGVTMHCLRHRFASRGYEATRDIMAVKEALGHSSVATTQRYTLVSRDDVRMLTEAVHKYDGPA